MASDTLLLPGVEQVNAPVSTLLSPVDLQPLLDRGFIAQGQQHRGRHLACSDLDALLAFGDLDLAGRALVAGEPATPFLARALLYKDVRGALSEIVQWLEHASSSEAHFGGVEAALLLGLGLDRPDLARQYLRILEERIERDDDPTSKTLRRCDLAKAWTAIGRDPSASLEAVKADLDRALSAGSIPSRCALATTWLDLGGDPQAAIALLEQAGPQLDTAEVWALKLGDEERAAAILEAIEQRAAAAAATYPYLKLARAWIDLLGAVETAEYCLEQLAQLDDEVSYAEGRHELFGDSFMAMRHLSIAESVLDRVEDLVSIALAWSYRFGDEDRAQAALTKAQHRAASPEDRAKIAAARQRLGEG